MSKQQIIKIVISVLIAALTALGAAFGLSSCNVTRTITTKSEYWQKADTSVVIQTKTIETYDASKKGLSVRKPLLLRCVEEGALLAKKAAAMPLSL